MKLKIAIEGGDERLRDTIASDIKAYAGEFELETDAGEYANVNSVSMEYSQGKVVLNIDVLVEKAEEESGEDE